MTESIEHIHSIDTAMANIKNLVNDHLKLVSKHKKALVEIEKLNATIARLEEEKLQTPVFPLFSERSISKEPKIV